MEESVIEVAVDEVAVDDVGLTVGVVAAPGVDFDVDVIGVDVSDDVDVGRFVVGMGVDVEVAFGTDVEDVYLSVTTGSLASYTDNGSTYGNSRALEVIAFGASNNAGSSAPNISLQVSDTV